MPSTPDISTLHKSACILCSLNCGLDIQTGGQNDREIIKIKGDRDNISSRGYLCEKASRLNFYQNAPDRLDSPMRRTPNGNYEPIDWNTAIREIALRLKAVQTHYGGEKILFVGGGGQGNHLGALYSDGLLKTLGVRFRTNSLAQEKTGEFWVDDQMFGGGVNGDFSNAQVAVFLGKNPWQSHGITRARKVLKDIARDDSRTMIVIDPCITDTAELADIHLRLKPGTDAWCLTGLIAIILQEDLQDIKFIKEHTVGFEQITTHFHSIDIKSCAAICDIDEKLLRRVARLIATADSTSVIEDLGVQQNIHSTLVSYLQRILWVITGHFAKKGAHNIAVRLLSIDDASKDDVGVDGSSQAIEKSPVLGSRVISGLLPCNEIPDEILTDHPERFRAAIVESTNPVLAYADSARMREAFRALEFSVVIDVAMTETAREASYVLPASSIYEKYECVFFPSEFPRNHFHIRPSIFTPLPGTLSEPEIHTRLTEELGSVGQYQVRLLRAALKVHKFLFAALFYALATIKPSVIKTAPALLYRTLGSTLKDGHAAAVAPFWILSHQFVRKHRKYAHNAGFTGSLWQAGETMFDAFLNATSGFIYSDSGDNYTDTWNRVTTKDNKIHLHLPALFPGLTSLDTSPLELPEDFPFILSAGQRRTKTTNAIIRDASWNADATGVDLCMHPADADKQQLVTGDSVRIVTQSGSAVTRVEVTPGQRPGNLSLPNGFGIDYVTKGGSTQRLGVALNELTSSNHKDAFAGTPWHKYVPARIELI